MFNLYTVGNVVYSKRKCGQKSECGCFSCHIKVGDYAVHKFG